MAIFDNLGGLLGDLSDYGIGVPKNTGLISDTADIDAINKRALTSGLINAGLTYLATPKNLNAGSALPYLGRAALSGFGASQNVIDQALNTAYRNKVLSGREDNLYNVDGALVDKAGKVVYQSPTKQQERKTAVVDGVLVDANTGEKIYESTKPQKLNTDIIDVGGKKILINKDTGAPIQEYKITDGGLGLKDIYGEPQKDLNGNLVYVPKIPGYPIRDMSGKPIAGNVQLADKKEPTESQANAYTYYSRMEEADKIIKDLNGKYDPYKINIKTSGKTALIPGGQDVANYFLSENDQKVEQAQRNFINAVLRRESGAVISPEEFANANTQYFDQPNDKPGVLKQKAANRRTAIEGIKRAAGPSIRKASQDGQSNVVNFEDLQ